MPGQNLRNRFPEIQGAPERLGIFWQHYRVIILGLLGWIVIALNYPIDWRLPTYAGY